MSLVSLLKRPGPSGFGYGSTAEQVTEGLDLTGKTYLVTGCATGLGRETVRVLRMRGAQVLGTGRTEARANETCGPLGATPLACDLSEPPSVLGCVKEVERLGATLDAIICNAGIMCPPALVLQHGIESQFFTNHVGHFLLVTRLLSSLKPEGRVVVVSSNAHRRAPAVGIDFENLSGARGYDPWQAYGMSKLANLLFARRLAAQLAGGRQTVNALHPGVIATDLARSMSAGVRAGLAVGSLLAFKSVAEGAATQVYLAVHPAVARTSGKYFSDCNEKESTPQGRDMGQAERLWGVTEKILAPWIGAAPPA
jgi:NAD(P)-dependent dehydrogenase (short-subunit alcohol dehydrogenase family)